MKKATDLTNEIIQWGWDALSARGYLSKNQSPEVVQSTPWSLVLRFETLEGDFYIKHTPPLLALEANIIQLLRDQFDAPVPEVIAHNVNLDCFLMKDAGRPLREILKKQFNVELFCKAIDEFTTMQVSVADHVDSFINISVPDWRLDKFPEKFEQLLTQKDLLMQDGLSESEMKELESRVPQVRNLCHELSAYAIKQTIVQPDFNDNNTLIDESQTMTIIDLGEIAISHPFFPLLNALQQMEKHHGVKAGSSDHLKIRDAYLKNFLAFESRDNLLNALKLAHSIWFVFEALAGQRLIEACDNSKKMSYVHTKLINSLRTFVSM